MKKAETVLRQAAKREPDDIDTRFRLAVVLYQIGYCYWEHKDNSTGPPFLRGHRPVDEFVRARSATLNMRSTWRWRRPVSPPPRTPTNATSSNARPTESLKRLAAERPDENRVRIALARVTTNRGTRAADATAEKLHDEARALLTRGLKAIRMNRWHSPSIAQVSATLAASMPRPIGTRKLSTF